MVAYRTVPGYGKRYLVGDDGSVWVRHNEAWRAVAQTVRGGMYRVVGLRRGHDTSVPYVHELVLRVFVGPRPPGKECRHLNGIKTDNRLANLQWGTRLENAADRKRHGTDPRGERNPRARLTRDQVEDARARVAAGESCAAVAKEMGVGRATMHHAVVGYTWQDLPGAIMEPLPKDHARGEKSGAARLTETLVLTLRDAARAGEQLKDLSERYGLPKTTVLSAVRGTTWSHLPGAVPWTRKCGRRHGDG